MSIANILDASASSLPNSTTTIEPPYFSEGEEIQQNWSPVFVFFAFVTSFVASFSAVRLLDHTLWRSEKEKQHASAVIIKHPHGVAAVLLGFGTVWSMHFVGMAAVTLDRTPMCYDWPVTIASLCSAVGLMWCGVALASRDIFRGPERVARLKEIVILKKVVTAKGRHDQANRTIHRVAFFHQPWKILAGGTIAASGALVMHYTGMMALRGPFSKRWSVPYVATSVVLGIVVCCFGFWIIFRLLHWKVERFWLRPASAAVIALAVCCLHFFGMVGVTYSYDGSRVDACQFISSDQFSDPNAWTPHQIVALTVALVAPCLALLIENLICRELFYAYCKLKDPSLTIEFLLEAASKSKDEGVRRASHMMMTHQKRASMPTENLAASAALTIKGLEEEGATMRRRSSSPTARRGSGADQRCNCMCHLYGEEKRDESGLPVHRKRVSFRSSGKEDSSWDDAPRRGGIEGPLRTLEGNDKWGERRGSNVSSLLDSIASGLTSSEVSPEMVDEKRSSDFSTDEVDQSQASPCVAVDDPVAMEEGSVPKQKKKQERSTDVEDAFQRQESFNSIPLA